MAHCNHPGDTPEVGQICLSVRTLITVYGERVPANSKIWCTDRKNAGLRALPTTIFITVKILKFGTPQTIAIIVLNW